MWLYAHWGSFAAGTIFGIVVTASIVVSVLRKHGKT